MLHTQKAAVLIDGIWRAVEGCVEFESGMFMYLHNGRMQKITDGNYRSYPVDYSMTDMDAEVMALNIELIIINNPVQRRELLRRPAQPLRRNGRRG